MTQETLNALLRDTPPPAPPRELTAQDKETELARHFAQQRAGGATWHA